MRLKLYRGKWAIVWSDNGRTKRHSTGCVDRAAAEVEFRDWQHKKAAAALPKGRVTVGTILEEYFKAKPGVVSRTALKAWWRNHLPEHVTSENIDAYLKSRGAKSASTLRSEIAILLTALKWARKSGWTTVSTDNVKLPAPSAPREKWITRDQAEGLINASVSAHMQLFTMLAVHTGARAGAILDLKWDRVTERFIDYNDPGKATGRKKRAVVPMHPDLLPALKAAHSIASTDYVIEYAGAQVHSVKKAFQRQAKRAGLGAIGPHTIRHSVATWLAMEGVSMKKIADLLGNSEKMVERVYAKFAPGYLADVVDKLGRGQVVQMNRSIRDIDGTPSKTKQS